MIRNEKIAGHILRFSVHSQCMSDEIREYIEANERQISELEADLVKSQQEAKEWKAFYFEALGKLAKARGD